MPQLSKPVASAMVPLDFDLIIIQVTTVPLSMIQLVALTSKSSSMVASETSRLLPDSLNIVLHG
jgi:hypothetical protein